jgi:hypothetical protein
MKRPCTKDPKRQANIASLSEAQCTLQADEQKKEVKQAKKAEASSEPAAEAAAVETKATNGKKRAREDRFA